MKNNFTITIEVTREYLTSRFLSLSCSNLLQTEQKIEKLMRDEKFVALLAEDMRNCWEMTCDNDPSTFNEVFKEYFE